MLEREAESTAKATDPGPTTGKELVTKGGENRHACGGAGGWGGAEGEDILQESQGESLRA